MATYSSTSSNTIVIDGTGYTMAGQTADYNTVHEHRLDGDDLPVANAGELTTRSSGTAGTLTMESGHTITTGARLDIYWETQTSPVVTAGSCRGATVGSVSGNSVPFTGASGTALPLVNALITAAVPAYVSPGSIDPSTLLAWGMNIAGIATDHRCTVSLGAYGTAYVEGGAIVLNSGTTGTGYGDTAAWASTNGGANAITSFGTISRIYVSHGDPDNAATLFKLSLGAP